MPVADNLYSQWVGWLKILLPLGALALLSTLFLFARNPPAETEISLPQVAELARDQQLTTPKFSGITDTGAIMVVSARTARPSTAGPDVVDVSDLRLEMDNPGGSTLLVTGITGNLDARARIARFSGLVRMVTSTGYIMETGGLTVTLDDGTAISDGLLEIRAPFGQLTAGQVTFQADGSDTGYQMLFTNGVTLVYRPQD